MSEPKRPGRKRGELSYNLFKRRKTYWMDVRIEGDRTRESLETQDRGEAFKLMNERIEQLKGKDLKAEKKRSNFARLDIKSAVEAYSKTRRAQVSPRMVKFWQEQSVPLINHFGDLPLRKFTVEHLTDYQNARLDTGKAGKTINHEVSVLRQLLKHAKRWDRIAGEYKKVKDDKPFVGRALSEEEQQRLFETAQSNDRWLMAYTAFIMGCFSGMRGVEIRHLQWKDIDFDSGKFDIRRSKTSAGWRSPTLNAVCRSALLSLRRQAEDANIAEPEHFIFPARVKGKIEPTLPAKGWRSAWRSIRQKAARNDEGEVIYPSLLTVRFHDLRHCATTRLAEAGIADHVIQQQIGHMSPDMVAYYSHVRRQALNAAAAVLEPSFLRQPATQAVEELVN